MTVGYLPQEPDALSGETLRAYLARRTGAAEAERELEKLAQELDRDPTLAAAYAEALKRFLALGGDDLDARARAVCADLGLPANRLDLPVEHLSGGEAARSALAGILLARFDIFLLDEPTNDLDFAGLERLERFVTGLRGGAVLVLAFMMLWTGKWHYRSKCMTGAEWQIFRFGVGPGAQFARIITALSNIVMAVGMLALTVYLILGALLSGYLWAFLQDVPLRVSDYFRQLAASLSGLDFALLALKTWAFGFIIAIVTCYHGLAQPLHLEEVSSATVRAVAQSVIACVLLDALFIIIYLAA